jgi:hypothetical protein
MLEIICQSGASEPSQQVATMSFFTMAKQTGLRWSLDRLKLCPVITFNKSYVWKITSKTETENRLKANKQTNSQGG